MRSLSTSQSILDHEFTRLAIIECVASVAIYIGLGVYLGTFKYLAIAVASAPFMLLRTQVSAEWGLQVYKRFYVLLLKLRILPPLLFVPVFYTLLPVGGTAIRIIGTVYWAVRSPFQTIKQMPQNWLRQSFCIDLAHPPEIVPLESSPNSEVFTFAQLLELIRSRPRIVSRIAQVFLSLPALLLGWLPAILYRISFKATLLAYAPFVWVAHTTTSNILSVKLRLTRITKGELEGVRRKLSWAILTTLGVKFAFLYGWIDKGYIASKFPSERFATMFILDGWPWWQITLATDAVMSFFLLFFADAALARLEGPAPWREERVLKTVSVVSFLRSGLSIITISYFFYVALIATAGGSMRRVLMSLIG